MKINQVSVELGLPSAVFKDAELRATITYAPGKPASTHVWLAQSDLSLEQLQIVGDFVNRLSLFGDKAEELVKTIIERR